VGGRSWSWRSASQGTFERLANRRGTVDCEENETGGKGQDYEAWRCAGASRRVNVKNGSGRYELSSLRGTKDLRGNVYLVGTVASCPSKCK
jgi:hypothetical protein